MDKVKDWHPISKYKRWIGKHCGLLIFQPRWRFFVSFCAWMSALRSLAGESPTGSGCSFCNQDKHIEHLFLIYPLAYSVWSCAKDDFNIRMCITELLNARQWLLDFLSCESKLHATFTTITILHIWELGNDARGNGASWDPSKVSSIIQAMSSWSCNIARSPSLLLGTSSRRQLSNGSTTSSYGSSRCWCFPYFP